MRVELKELQRRTGITFIYVTHDQAEALALSDQIAVIHSGRLQQFGSPDEVYSQPRNRVVADFMGHVNFLAGSMHGADTVRLSGGHDVLLETSPALALGSAVDVAIRPEDVILAADGRGLPARITGHTFLGNLNEYIVTLASGEAIRAQTPARQRFAPGSAVSLVLDPARISVFAGAPAGSTTEAT
jgi:ABC-type Fe3+/spermidine/putrescine transport system ATPase subunit